MSPYGVSRKGMTSLSAAAESQYSLEDKRNAYLMFWANKIGGPAADYGTRSFAGVTPVRLHRLSEYGRG